MQYHFSCGNTTVVGINPTVRMCILNIGEPKMHGDKYNNDWLTVPYLVSAQLLLKPTTSVTLSVNCFSIICFEETMTTASEPKEERRQAKNYF